MVFRNPLRPGYAVLLGTSLAACFGGAIGCNVYSDELLQRRNDPDGSRRDVSNGTEDAVAKDGSSGIDAPARDTNTFDATAPEGAADRDGGPYADASPDGAAGDGGGADPDAGGATRDASPDLKRTDATFDGGPVDATMGANDADAAPGLDASDAAPADAAGGDARDGGSAPDVTIDVDGGIAPPTFRVVRVGDGTTPLSGASASAFIEERAWDGQLVGGPLALPTNTSGRHHALTLSGVATSEGALALSLDGRYLALAGYATSPGRASVASSNQVERVVARVDAAGTIDTSTSLGEAFSGSNARSAATADGTGFWVGGSSGGVWYFPLGGAGSAQIVASPDNVRLVALFGDQLYACSGTSPMTTVFTVGNGLPTTGVQDVAALAGLPRSGMSPYAFALFDRNPAVAGLDTLYVADDRSPENDGNGGGIQKWTSNGSTWSRAATFSAVGVGTASFRGVAGVITATGVRLVASTAETSPNRLVVFVDDGAPNVTGTVVATAASDTIFRGVTLSPHP